MKRNTGKVALSVALVFSFSICIFGSFSASATEEIFVGPIISIGPEHTVLLETDGNLWVWGDNSNFPNNENTQENNYKPERVLSDVKSVYPGSHHTLAIKRDGSLWGWGIDQSFLFDNSISGDSTIPVKVIEGVKSVSFAYDTLNYYYNWSHIMIIKEDNSLWAWGDNYWGQLGDGTNESKTSPVKIMDNVYTVITNLSSTIALKKDGSLWTWGEYDTIAYGKEESLLTPVKIMDNVKNIYGDDNHYFVIKEDSSLWAWGRKIPTGSYWENRNETPVKIMDNVRSVSIGSNHGALIKEDDSLWMWGLNNSGQVGDGTNVSKFIPVEVMTEVKSVSLGNNHTIALKKDTTLWSWGENENGQIGNGSIEKQTTPIRIMDNVKSAYAATHSSFAISNEGNLIAWGNNYWGHLGDGTTEDKLIPTRIIDGLNSITGSPYLYDINDPGAQITFDMTQIEQINDLKSALNVIDFEASKLSSDQKNSATGIDLMTLLSEVALSKAISQELYSNSLIITAEDTELLDDSAVLALNSIISNLESSGINTAREIRKTVTFFAPENNIIEIEIEPLKSSTQIDGVNIKTPLYGILIPISEVEYKANEDALHVKITTNSAHVGSRYSNNIEMSSLSMISDIDSIFFEMVLSNSGAAIDTKTYTVEFNKPLKNTVKVSFPPAAGNVNYQTVYNEKGDNVGGKYNPASGMIDVKINTNGTYYVKEFTRNFTDITNKSKEMQLAIKVLSSKGIIGGTSESKFSPDQVITRAQIAQLITKTLAMYHVNENGNFTDVNKAEWFYGAAGSAKKHGLMVGTSETEFSPNKNIPKDQILVVAANVLKNQMKYKTPSNKELYLKKFADRNDLASWSLSDLALVTKEGLVVYRTDEKLVPSKPITRGDAAIVLYRLFSKIW